MMDYRYFHRLNSCMMILHDEDCQKDSLAIEYIEHIILQHSSTGNVWRTKVSKAKYLSYDPDDKM